jgi:GNAT superfamily N-acetyltransferase
MELIKILSTDDEHWQEAIDLYTTSFPERERRDIKALEIVLTDKRFHAVKFVINNGFAALMFYWQLDNLIFLEHLAVTKEMQGKAIGKQMMEWLLNVPVPYYLLEVEHPFDDDSRRRIAFYERLGFSTNHYEYFQPPYRATDDPLPLLLMSRPSISGIETFQLLTKELHEVVYDRFLL